jgi:hypothetical protein
MRFMILMKANRESESGALPDPSILVAMTKYNEDLVKAGVLVGAEGLYPSSKGARVTFAKGKPPLVTDGPFPETKELIAGYWLWQLKSKEEAVKWVLRLEQALAGCPLPDTGAEIEIRQVFEAADLAAEYPGS